MLKEEQFYAVTFGAGWRTRGPEGPPAINAPAKPKKKQQLTVKLPRGPQPTSSSSGNAATRNLADVATGRAYSTQESGRLTWRNQKWRATSQQWANNGGQYITTTSIAIIMAVIPAIILSLLFQRSSNRSSSSDLTITSMHCCNM